MRMTTKRVWQQQKSPYERSAADDDHDDDHDDDDHDEDDDDHDDDDDDDGDDSVNLLCQLLVLDGQQLDLLLKCFHRLGN